MKQPINEQAAAHANAVLGRVARLGSEGISGFDWVELESDTGLQRITKVSKFLKDKTIAESFAAAYGVAEVFGSKENVTRLQAITCKELHPGDIVELRILNVDKKGVTFEQEAYKETIISTVNLGQYPRFKAGIPSEPIRVKVMSKAPNKVYVDPFQPLIEEFVKQVGATVNTQANVKSPIVTKVYGLQHMRSGYIGRIRIPSVSEMCGKDMYMQAFIPGSQITLNIESDFGKWDGADVDAFITNLSMRPGTTDTTVACSVKEYLRFVGNLKAIEMFKNYTEENKAWKDQLEKVYDGNITGICNSRSKTGVFVEIPSIGITGMVPMDKEELTKYHPGACKVRITGFDELMKFNREVGQMQHVEPYKIEDGVLRKVNIKCILAFAE